MTVAELIAKLSYFPEHFAVMMQSEERLNRCCSPKHVAIDLINMKNSTLIEEGATETAGFEDVVVLYAIEAEDDD